MSSPFQHGNVKAESQPTSPHLSLNILQEQSRTQHLKDLV